MSHKKVRERRAVRRSSFFRAFRLFRMHPAFLLVGVWYACTGELFLFALSTLVAVQHECAHAFASAKLGYRLNAIILMPFGAVLDGDMQGISLKDEIFVAACGPLCNLLTAIFFVALWWFVPTMYAFTDVVFYSSLAIALVNLLPAYPLDGGRIFKCILTRALSKKLPKTGDAAKIAKRVCRIFTLCFSLAFFIVFAILYAQNAFNFSLLTFGFFLLFGAFGNRDKTAVYEKMDFSFPPALKKGVEIRRVAILESCPIKDAFRFLSRESYLVLEVYDERERKLFELPQNQLSRLFLLAETPYQTLRNLYEGQKEVFF